MPTTPRPTALPPSSPRRAFRLCIIRKQKKKKGVGWLAVGGWLVGARRAAVQRPGRCYRTLYIYIYIVLLYNSSRCAVAGRSGEKGNGKKKKNPCSYRVDIAERIISQVYDKVLRWIA